MTTELYKRHRPKLFKELLGQSGTIKMLARMVKGNKIPHTILLHGPSGCGKTTIARILCDKLGCEIAHDVREINCADFRGIDTVREIRTSMHISAIGENRAWIIDEAHQLSSQAQNAFLKILEDTPSHVYFMLATTSPEKLIKTIRNRCTEIKLESLPNKEIKRLVDSVLEKEKAFITEEVMDKLTEVSEGSPRKSLVLLEQILNVDSEEEQIDTLEKADAKRQAIELARALINPKSKWNDVAAIIKEIDEDPETLRWMILGYASSVMLNNGRMVDRASHIVECFSENFFDTKKAGLVAASYEVIQRSNR